MASTSISIETIPTIVARPDGDRGPIVIICHDKTGIDGFMRDTGHEGEGLIEILEVVVPMDRVPIGDGIPRGQPGDSRGGANQGVASAHGSLPCPEPFRLGVL